MEKLKEFWNNLSTREKISIGVLVAGVVGYAFYKKSKASSSASTIPATGQPVDQYGNQLYPTNLSGVYAQQPNGSYATAPQGTTSASTPTTLTASTLAPDTRVTQAGDSLYSYSSYFGTPIARLQDLNPQFAGYTGTQVLPTGSTIIVR